MLFLIWLSKCYNHITCKLCQLHCQYGQNGRKQNKNSFTNLPHSQAVSSFNIFNILFLSGDVMYFVKSATTSAAKQPQNMMLPLTMYPYKKAKNLAELHQVCGVIAQNSSKLLGEACGRIPSTFGPSETVSGPFCQILQKCRPKSIFDR